MPKINKLLDIHEDSEEDYRCEAFIAPNWSNGHDRTTPRGFIMAVQFPDIARLSTELVPPDAMFYGVLAVQIPHDAMTQSGGEGLCVDKYMESMLKATGENKLLKILDDCINDETDFSMPSSFAGIFSVNNKQRNWKNDYWVVAQTSSKKA